MMPPRLNLQLHLWRRMKVLLFALINLAGLGLCLYLLGHPSHSQSLPIPDRGAHLGTWRPLLTPPPPPEFPTAAQRNLRAKRISAPTEIVAGPWRPHATWDTLGADLIWAEDHTLLATRIQQGYRLSPGHLAADPSRPQQQKAVFFAFHPDPARTLLESLAKRLYREPLESRWSFAEQRLVAGVHGQSLDIEASLLRLEEAWHRGQERVELQLTQHRVASAEASDLAAFNPTQRLARFVTHFNARDRARTTNLRLAADALDGVVIMPGNHFSYNGVVGERSEARGFKNAPVIEQGEIVEGIGGGACQISSTIHAAALFAAMNIVERYNHSLPSSYIEKGLDAVVAWPLLDLKVGNPYPFPVVLRVRIDNDRVIAEFLAEQPGHRVVLRRETVEVLPFEEQITVDPNLESGTFKITRRGVPGAKIQRARIIWRGEEEHFERLLMDTYQSRAARVTVAPDTIYPPPEDAPLTATPATANP